MLFKGIMVILDSSGKIVQMKLSTHTHELTIDGLKQADVIAVLNNCLFLFMFKIIF